MSDATNCSGVDDSFACLARAGYADVVSKVPVSPDHLFGIGSITKTFVAIVTLQLVEEGRLDLAQTPQDILGSEVVGQVANADRATLAQLLNHTSGIPSWEDDPLWIREGRGEDNVVGRIWGRTDALAYLKGVPPTNDPGESYSYSNTNHTLLGLIIEKITGNDIVHEIKKRILVPVGITDIYLEGFQAIPRDRLASRYHYATPEFKRDAGVHEDFEAVTPGLIDASSSNLSVEWTAGGMLVTASDLAKYSAAMYWHETEDLAVAIVANVGTMHIGQDLPGARSIVANARFWELALALADLRGDGY